MMFPGWRHGTPLARWIVGPMFAVYAAVGVWGRIAHAQDSAHAVFRTPARMDPKAVSLLADANAAFQHASTLVAEVQLIVVRNGMSQQWLTRQDVRFQRSGYVYWRETGGWEGVPRDTAAETSVVSCTPSASLWFDARSASVAPFHDERCDVYDLDPILQSFWELPPGRLLHAGEWSAARLTDPLVRSVRYVGREPWGGVMCDVVEWVYEQAYTMPEDTLVLTTRVFIDPARYMRRMVTLDSKGNRTEERIIRVRLDTALALAGFSVTPPEGRPVTIVHPVETTSWVGRSFPHLDLSAPLVQGGTVALRDLLRKKTGVLVWFWDTDCFPCMTEMPHMEQLARAARAHGVEVVALDVIPRGLVTESQRARRYRVFHSLTMPILLSRIVATPIQQAGGDAMLLDTSGRVVYQGKYDLDKFRAAIEALATTK